MRYHDDFQILTPCQTIRQIAFTPSQLHLLCLTDFFPLPMEYGDGFRIGWERHAVEAWIRRRDRSMRERAG